MMDDSNNRFDELLDDALRTYHRPPGARQFPLEEMWRAIEVQAFPATRRTGRRAQWLSIAAALVIGIGIGRLSFEVGHPRTTVALPHVADTQPGAGQRLERSSEAPLDLETSRYLGQAAALLIALPAETNAARPDRP